MSELRETLLEQRDEIANLQERQRVLNTHIRKLEAYVRYMDNGLGVCRGPWRPMPYEEFVHSGEINDWLSGTRT